MIWLVSSRRSQTLAQAITGYVLLLVAIYVAVYVFWPYTVCVIAVTALVAHFGGNAAVRRVERRRAREAERLQEMP